MRLVSTDTATYYLFTHSSYLCIYICNCIYIEIYDISTSISVPIFLYYHYTCIFILSLYLYFYRYCKTSTPFSSVLALFSSKLSSHTKVAKVAIDSNRWQTKISATQQKRNLPVFLAKASMMILIACLGPFHSHWINHYRQREVILLRVRHRSALLKFCFYISIWMFHGIFLWGTLLKTGFKGHDSTACKELWKEK